VNDTIGIDAMSQFKRESKFVKIIMRDKHNIKNLLRNPPSSTMLLSSNSETMSNVDPYVLVFVCYDFTEKRFWVD
jgi:hypothetical protein